MFLFKADRNAMLGFSIETNPAMEAGHEDTERFDFKMFIEF